MTDEEKKRIQYLKEKYGDDETAMKMIEAGASRLGCSAGIAIINGAASDAEY